MKKQVPRKHCSTKVALFLLNKTLVQILVTLGKKTTPTSSKAPVWKNFRGFSIE